MVGYLNRLYGDETPSPEVLEKKQVKAASGIEKALRQELSDAMKRIALLELDLETAQGRIKDLEAEAGYSVATSTAKTKGDATPMDPDDGLDDDVTPEGVAAIKVKSEKNLEGKTFKQIDPPITTLEGKPLETVTVKPWEVDGVSRQAYYKRQRASKAK